MQEGSYKIYNASAGSGKTYTLVKEYLKIILSSKNNWTYQHILAITFTNKAVSEMKGRILDSLYSFSKVSDFSNAPSLYKDLVSELEIEPADLKKKSKRILKDILHNYAFFDISTIDKFTHRLIRTFAKDLNLSQNFEVIMDTDLLLSEAVDRLINKAGNDKRLTKVLIDFTLEKIDEDKSWDVSFDLNKIGKLLFDETHAAHLDELKDKRIEEFLDLQKKLRNKINSIQQECTEDAKKVLQLIDANGLEHADFTRKTLPNHFFKIANNTFDYKTLYSNKLEENLTEGSVYNKSLDSGRKSLIDSLLPQLLYSYLSIKKNICELAFLKNAYGNIVPLTVLNAINGEVKEIEEERNQIHISAFNQIISKEIKNQPAPFIYERLGEKYKHYFIDEFQDTSQMQWENLAPLIGNALEGENIKGEKGSLFLVGDAKQAIYRWRGGKAEQFLNLTIPANNPFVVKPQINNLPSNYRSHEEIVKFNNDFFTHTSSFLSNGVFNSLFIEGNKQNYNSKEKGFVQLTFLDNDSNTENVNDLYCDEVLSTITSILKKKYEYRDICILVRENRKGVLLADYLVQKNIPVISADSLLLINSKEVRFLINLLKYCANPEDLDNTYSLLYYLAPKDENVHNYIFLNLRRLEVLLKNSYGFSFNRIKQTSVYDGLECAIKQFSLINGSNAHITYLLDTVLEIEQKEGTGIHTFLSYWDQKADKLSIPTSENINAVRIMSVHKAKGLEFPIVIFPFADSHIYKEIDKKLWVPIENNRDGFKSLLLNKKQEMEHYNAISKELFAEEQGKLELDAFNILYVALTRAIKGLFIITKKNLSAKGEHKTDYYSGLFIDYLTFKGLWNPEKTIYLFGLLGEAANERQSKNLELNIKHQHTHKERPSFNILTKGGVLWGTNRESALAKGNMLHHIMGLVETEGDVEMAFDSLIRNGDITEDEVDSLKNQVLQIIYHPLLSPFYKTGIEIINETDIITKEGNVLRPDRVVIAQNETTIIDYKTGLYSSSHKQQLYSYAEELENMGFTVTNKILIYLLNDGITPEFV